MRIKFYTAPTYVNQAHIGFESRPFTQAQADQVFTVVEADGIGAKDAEKLMARWNIGRKPSEMYSL